jgi:hypothetical protein
MLTFDDRFISDEAVGCLLWADETSMKRVRFSIGSFVLVEVLHGGNPVHDADNVKLCERERSRIEAACREAFSERGGDRVELQPSDFA